MTSTKTSLSTRLPFIDFTRGVVMILMAWDHVSSFWNPGKIGGEGLRGYFPYITDINQFYLRLITHICAPAFMFLAAPQWPSQPASASTEARTNGASASE